MSEKDTVGAQQNLLDRPLRDLLATYDDGADGEQLTLAEVFEFWGMVHPAEASSAIRHIDMGIEREGFTAQGNRHPDYQNTIRQVTREPFGRDGSPPGDSDGE